MCRADMEGLLRWPSEQTASTTFRVHRADSFYSLNHPSHFSTVKESSRLEHVEAHSFIHFRRYLLNVHPAL